MKGTKGFKYFFTDGRKLPANKRGKRYLVDYLLSYKNVNLGIVEAKSEDKDPLDGLQQAIAYAEKLINIETYYVGEDGRPL